MSPFVSLAECAGADFMMGWPVCVSLSSFPPNWSYPGTKGSVPPLVFVSPGITNLIPIYYKVWKSKSNISQRNQHYQFVKKQYDRFDVQKDLVTYFCARGRLVLSHFVSSKIRSDRVVQYCFPMTEIEVFLFCLQFSETTCHKEL